MNSAIYDIMNSGLNSKTTSGRSIRGCHFERNCVAATILLP